MTDEPEIKKTRNGHGTDDAPNYLAELNNLEDFMVKEVLGAHQEKKLIFILCHNTVEDKPGILILNKKPYPENVDEINECVQGLSFVRLSDNDIYLSADAHLPTKFNGEYFDVLVKEKHYLVNKSTFIYPSTEKHEAKYRFRPLHSIFESPGDYKNITLPYIEESQFNVDVSSIFSQFIRNF